MCDADAVTANTGFQYQPIARTRCTLHAAACTVETSDSPRSDCGSMSMAFVPTAIENASSAMKSGKLTATAFLFAMYTFAQTNIPTFKVETRSALVWDKVSPGNAPSSVIWDPLTGREIHRLTF